MLRPAALLMILFALCGLQTRAEENPRQRLEWLAGDWTIQGREDSFRELCEWFHKRSHLVCSSESRGPGGISRGVSVLSYSDRERRFVYYHYGSSGLVAAMDVFLEGTSLTATAERQEGADLLREQVSMTPLANGTFDFREVVSKNGGPWQATTQFRYVRRAPPASSRKEDQP